MDKYIAGLYLPTYDTKEEAIERAKEVSAEYGEDVGIFKQCGVVVADVTDEEA